MRKAFAALVALAAAAALLALLAGIVGSGKMTLSEATGGKLEAVASTRADNGEDMVARAYLAQLSITKLERSSESPAAAPFGFACLDGGSEVLFRCDVWETSADHWVVDITADGKTERYRALLPVAG